MNIELLQERIILKNLLVNENYFTKVFPYLSKELFTDSEPSKVIFSEIYRYNEKYSIKPNLLSIASAVGQRSGLTSSVISECESFFEFCKTKETYDENWLIDKTVDFIKAKKFINALLEASEKIEKKELDSELPFKLEDALSVNIDSQIGMSFADAEERWKKYTEKEDRIPFRLEKLNDVTRGGLTRKTLNCLMSSNTGGFKSGSMCSFTSDYLRLGYNVLYLSFEMAEDKVMERIDANLLDVEIDDLVNLGKERFIKSIQNLSERTFGKLIVKQYPTSQCNVGHIKNLLKDLKMVKNFTPDIIVFDYLGIMASQRYKGGEAEHLVLKAICEEVRGLCVEYNVVGWTAMQSNRSGASAGADISLSDISSSFATAFGFDLIWGVVTTPEFDSDHKLMIRQLKSRYGDINISNRFFLGMNKAKMKLFDLLNDGNDLALGGNTELTKNNNDAENKSFMNVIATSSSEFSRKRKGVDVSKFIF